MENLFILIAALLFLAFLLVLYVVSPLITPKPLDISGSHVLVTGGSSGIGKCVAVEVIKRGASVSILARNQARLTEAKNEVEQYIQDTNKQRVVCISVDLTKDFSIVQKAVSQAEEISGPVDMLVNSAGYSVNGRFEDIPIHDFQRVMDINYMGSVFATKAVVKGMKERKRGRIVFVSSIAGVFGLFGYSAYSASKYALRGLAESLQMEVKPYNVRVTLALPPDTDTPGYAEENLTKPKETRLISESAGLFQPSYVARAIIKDSLAGRFISCLGTDGYVVGNLICGMSPVTSITEATQQVVSMGFFRMIMLFVIDGFDRIVAKCAKERQEEDLKTKLKKS